MIRTARGSFVLRFVFRWTLILCPGVALGQAMQITDLHVDKRQLQPGETFTVAVMARGGANFCLRQDHFGTPPAVPGWKEHGSDYAFLPSEDFSGPGPYKNAPLCHRDNGKRDLDQRKGAWRVAVDTAGWREGTYQFQILATNRPALGESAGDTRAFAIVVGAAAASGAGGIHPRVEIAINAQRCSHGEESWPILSGRPNRMTVALATSRGSQASNADKLPVNLTLVRTQADGRQVRLSAMLTEQAPEAVFDLGVFAAPAVFDFEAGVLYRRGCRLRLQIGTPAGPESPDVLSFSQTIHAADQREVLQLGAAERVPHFGWRMGPLRPLDPPVLLWLDPAVLADPDDVRVRYQLRAEEARILAEQSLTRIPAVLRVTAADSQRPLYEEPVEVLPEQRETKLDVADWKEGRYRIEIVPQVSGSEDRDGPVVVYRRDRSAVEAVRLSPLAPWTLERDRARPEVAIRDFRQAVAEWSPGLPDDNTWEFRKAGPGLVFLIARNGDWSRPPVVLRPKLKGPYAVFAAAEKGSCYVRVGQRGIVREILAEPCFVEAAEMTGGEVAIYPASASGSGLRELRLIPVTPASVDRLAQITSAPPTPLRGVADWCDNFHTAGGRLAADQFDALLQGQAEVGMRSIAWAIGRSWVEYHSRLPDATRFPCTPLDQIAEPYRRTYAGRAAMINNYDPLAQVLEKRSPYGVEILPWLGMQRHYGESAYGGIFCSAWFRAHPEWRRWNKNASSPSGSAVCYYFPEVRKERVDIYCEVAERNPDGLAIGWCRQVPMLLYHPQMVAEYRDRTGIDPLKIDASRQREYRDWICWRADFVTETLRELKLRLGPIRQRLGRPVPVAVRIPSKGLFYNLAQGLDVETWCREGLIHEMQLDPLEDCGWRGEPHDVRPYLELGRRYNVPVFGGINGNTFWNCTAIMRRAQGLLEAGVAGIEIYESNNFALISPRRWIIPLLGNLPQLQAFLEDANLDACYPVWSRNAASGYDNHSFGGNWSVFGMGANGL